MMEEEECGDDDAVIPLNKNENLEDNKVINGLIIIEEKLNVLTNAMHFVCQRLDALEQRNDLIENKMIDFDNKMDKIINICLNREKRDEFEDIKQRKRKEANRYYEKRKENDENNGYRKERMIGIMITGISGCALPKSW